MPSLTPSNPMTALVNLDLTAVALCEEGANSRAHILLTKRKENKSMNFSELMKALNPEQAKIITDHIGEIETAKDKTIGELNAKITDLSGEVDTLQKQKPTEPKEEDILKGMSPEVRAIFEKQQNQISELIAVREEALAKERFAKVKALPVEETELMGVLKAASPAVVAILEKAAAAIEAGLSPVGKAADGAVVGTTADDQYAKLEKSARKIMEESNVTFEKAFTEACERDPETYKNYVKGVK